MKPLILIEGNVGAGKSTFSRKVSESLGMRCLEEPVDPELLQAFYDDMQGMGLAYQFAMLHARWALQMSAAAECMIDCGYSGVCLDRSLFGDRVFIRTMVKLGHVTPIQMKIYERAVQNMCLVLFPPTTLVYLSASPEVCLQRIRQRNRPQEVGITIEYLQMIHEGYQELLREAKTGFWPWSHAISTVVVPWDPHTVTEEQWAGVAKMVAEAIRLA